MNCLYKMHHCDLVDLVENQLCMDQWLVRNAGIQERTNCIKGTPKFDILNKIAQAKGYRFSDIEVVTWIDSLSILYRAFAQIEDERLLNEITILQEYCIPYSNKRADFMLVHHNKILILEFSFRKLGYELKYLQYETKLTQAMGYKELLLSLLPREVDIGTYTFLVEAEEEDFYTKIEDDEGNLPNDVQITSLAQYIEKFFKKNESVALDALKRISNTDNDMETALNDVVVGIDDEEDE